MNKLREIVLDNDSLNKEKQKAISIAKILITIAIYLITAGTLMEYISIPLMLKTIGFILAGHAFYFLWKSSRQYF